MNPHPCVDCGADLWGVRHVCPACKMPKPKVKKKVKPKKKKRDRWPRLAAVRQEQESPEILRARHEALERLSLLDEMQIDYEKDKRMTRRKYRSVRLYTGAKRRR